MSDELVQFIDSLMPEEAGQFERYYELLVDWNERMNLTGITERTEVYIKHFWDSLVIQNHHLWRELVGGAKGGSLQATELEGSRETRNAPRALPANPLRVADIGTGAGFPGIPLAICNPRVEFTLMDSLAKRLRFLEEVCKELGLQNVKLVHGRAEDLGWMQSYRNQFDVVVSRAVARLNVLFELMGPMCKVHGMLYAYKGPGLAEELADGRRAAKVLGLEIAEQLDISLPDGYGDRTVVVARQLRGTPKTYPRKPGVPQKSPL